MPQVLFNFADRTVIVTGGTRGIGRAITQAFLDSGARVLATYIGNEAAASELLAAQSAEAKGRLELHRLDAANHAAAEAFFKDLAARQVVPSVLVNNAGIRKDAALAMMPLDDWDAVIRANLTSTYVMSKFGVQAMMSARYGRIVVITSPAGRFGFTGQANYSATKAGQVGLVRSLSKEVAKRNITVNAVSPGFIDTALLADLDDKTRQGYLEMVPLKRFGKPEDVAASVQFLASDAAGYITGTVLEVAGGL